MVALILALSLSLSLLLSPEVQVILGNSVGFAGWYVWPTLGVVALVAFSTLRLYGDQSEFALLSNRLGTWLPLTSLLASRVLFFITGATVVLVTAGYVFNEVFLSSFPNFGFAFLVLGVVVLLNLVAGKAVRGGQVLFMLIWLGALLYLVAAGVGVESHPRAVGEVAFSYQGLLLPFLLLVGVELGVVSGGGTSRGFTSAQLWFGFLLVLVLLALWGSVMAKMVNPETLASSYIPHTKAARRLLGDPGRMALGMAMIAGTAALVNGLLAVLVLQVRDVCRVLGRAGGWLESPWSNRLLVLFIGISPGIMMARGMAGYEITEVYLRAALLFWLLHYGLLHLVAVQRQTVMWRIVSGFVVVLLWSVVAGLIYSDHGRSGLMWALGCTVLSAGGLAGVVSFTMAKRIS